MSYPYHGKPITSLEYGMPSPTNSSIPKGRKTGIVNFKHENVAYFNDLKEVWEYWNMEILDKILVILINLSNFNFKKHFHVSNKFMVHVF